MLNWQISTTNSNTPASRAIRYTWIHTQRTVPDPIVFRVVVESFVYVDFLEHESWEFYTSLSKGKKKLRTSAQLLSWFLVTQPQQRSSSVIIVEEIAQQPNLNFMKRSVVLLLNSVMENSIVERGYNIVFLEGPGRFCSLLTWSFFFSLWVVSPYFAIRTRGANGTQRAEPSLVVFELGLLNEASPVTLINESSFFFSSQALECSMDR